MDVIQVKASPVVQGAGLFFLCLTLTGLGNAAQVIEWLPLYPVAAVLFGLLVRFPELARAKFWLAMYSGMLAADVAQGQNFEQALWLNACLLLQVLIGCALLSVRPLTGLYEPKNALYLFFVAIFSVAIGASLAMPMSIDYVQQSATQIWLSWFSGQFATMMLVAPVFICWPGRLRGYELSLQDLVPITSVLVMIVLARLVEGPGAMAFVLPALLWCAMRYRIFTLSLIILVVGTLEIMHGFNALSALALDVGEAMHSVRLGVAMMVLSPLLVATATHAHQQLLARTQHHANHDFLTAALTRRAFTQKAKRLLRTRRKQRQSIGLVLMDLDHFKSINDTYGHAAGDQVLREFAQVVREHLREQDVFGRLGGEEFALLLPGVGQSHALHVAERLRKTVADHSFRFKHAPLHVTVSMGLSWVPTERSSLLSALLEEADEALYQAKAQGRNRVCTYMVQDLALEKLKLSIY